MKSKGFTLIELLVVVAIIGILATVVLASLSSGRASARDARRLADIKTIQTALELYALDNGGQYPTPGWASSNVASSWAALETQLGTTLPKDPTNQTSTSTSSVTTGLYTYGYYAHAQAAQCSGRAYMLVVNLETKRDTSAGVYLCDTTRGYGDALVVGMDGNGNLIGPGTLTNK